MMKKREAGNMKKKGSETFIFGALEHLATFPHHGLARRKQDRCPICVEQEKWIVNMREILRKGLSR